MLVYMYIYDHNFFLIIDIFAHVDVSKEKNDK